MDKNKEITEVIFRKWKKDIIALFPYEIFSRAGNVMSYMRIGQHGEADYLGIVKCSTLATPSEYRSLKRELKELGYNLLVIQKRNHKKYIDALTEIMQRHGNRS